MSPELVRDGAILGAGLALMVDSLGGHSYGVLLFAVAAAFVAFRSRIRASILIATSGVLTANLIILQSDGFRVFSRSVGMASLAVFVVEGLIISALLTALRTIWRRSASEAATAGTPGWEHEDDRSPVYLESSQRSREQFRLLVDDLKDHAIFMLDVNGLVVTWNQGADRILGFRKPEALGNHLSRFYTPEDIRDGRPGADLAAAAANERHEVEGWRVRRDGSRLWAHVGITALHDAGGALRGFATITRDHSERKRAEDDLRNAHDQLEQRVARRTSELAEVNRALRAEIVERERVEGAIREQGDVLRSILDNMAEAVIAADREGRLLLCNPAASSMFGVDATDLDLARLPRVEVDLLASDLGPMAGGDSLLGRTIGGESIDDAELFVPRAGTPGGLWTLISGRPLRDGEGSLRGGIIVCRDVTERRRVEEELKVAKEAAEAANSAKDRFLAVLSHELRTPLTPVLLAAGAALDDGGLSPDLRATFETIRNNVELEARLIDDLLDVSKATTGRLGLRLSLVDAHAAIRRSVELCRAEVDSAGLTLDVEPTARDHHVEADPARIQQVLWNLIKNATKFTPSGGRIAIRTRNREREPGLPGPSPLIIEVSDTGIGIAERDLPRIFDPFEQGEPDFRERFGGLGLGLAIGRSVVESHGGRLTAVSEGPGLGSTFVLELETVPAPAVAPPPPSPGHPSGPSGGAARLKILLVEDNKETLHYMGLILGGRGHTVRKAADLASALRYADADEFDLVISDIQLPDGSGLELMGRLSESRAQPGIAISGFGSEDDISLSRAAGFSEHLTKPIDMRILETAILRATGQLVG